MISFKKKIFSYGQKLQQGWKSFVFTLAGKEASNHDQQLVYSLSGQKIPQAKQFKYLPKFLNRKEALIILLATIVLLVSLIWLLSSFIKNHLELKPKSGGHYSEALVGRVQSINPLYSLNRDVDADIVSLVYSSLLKRNTDGTLVNDLVKDLTVDGTGKVYDINLRDDVKFHHGEKLSADDVVFTFEALTNPEYNSPWRESFSGVSVEKTGDFSIRFTLPEAYAGFTELLSFGILPSDLWSGIDPSNAFLSELSLKPVGSGPYQFASLNKSQDGAMKEYVLEVYPDYYNHAAYISDITFKFYNSAPEALKALNGGDVDGLAYLPLGESKKLVAKNSYNFHKLAWPQTASLFYNTAGSKSLGEKKFRQAIASAIDRDKIVSEALNNYAKVINNPLAPESWAYNNSVAAISYNPAESQKVIEDYGWKRIDISDKEADLLVKDDLSDEQKNAIENFEIKKEISDLAKSAGLDTVGFWHYQDPASKGADRRYLYLTISTIDSEDYIKTAQMIKESWEQIGLKVAIKTYPLDKMDEIIRGRSYQVLLMSQLSGADPDFYAFWHSSQAGSGGYNLADYKNKAVDDLLSAARLSSDKQDRINKYNKAQELIAADAPASFLFRPDYLYLQAKKIRGFDLTFIASPAERFAGVSNWHIKTKKRLVWKKQS